MRSMWVMCAASLLAACAGRHPAVCDRLGPLHAAAAAGRVQELQALLERGADVNERAGDPTEWTPLHCAAIAGRAEAAAMLLKHGANPDARGQYDLTPLHWAALAGQAETAALLLRRGARVGARDLYGRTPLHAAADAQVAGVLLAHGAPLDAADDRGMTPLHTARNRRVARLLLEKGADVRRRTRDGRTAWEMAVWDELEPRGLTAHATRAAARLRGERAAFGLTLRNVSSRPITGLLISAASPACAATAAPATVGRLAPGQMITVSFDLARRSGGAAGEHPLTIILETRAGELGRLALEVDTTPGATLEDRGMIRLGRASLQRAPSRAQYLAYAAVPLLLLAAWLLWRRRR